jgi:hypothetical protein
MDLLEDYPGIKRVAGWLSLLLAAALLGFLLFTLGKDVALWIFGRPATASIVERWAEPVGDPDAPELDFRYYVRYRFQTPEGRVVTSVKAVSAQEWTGVGFGAQGRASVDEFDGEAEGPAAPVYREQEHLTENTGGGLLTLGQVPIVYFPLYPAHNRIEESRYVPVLACTYLPFLVMAGAGLLVARHLLRREEVGGRWEWTLSRG